MKNKGTPGEIQLITDDAHLIRFGKHLQKCKKIGVDTEAASFHRYFDRVFLIQVSSETENAVIDPLTIEDLDPLGRVLENNKIEVIFHDADFDLRNINRDYGYVTTNIFDTRIAAQLAGEPAIGLGALISKYFEVEIDKKFQRADWSRRPLTDEMIAYAANDTRYLLPLRNRLEQILGQRKRISWARAEFKRLDVIRGVTAENDPLAFMKMKGAHGLEKQTMSVLKALYDWRESEARERDRPTFRIVSNQILIGLAKKAPGTAKGLEKAGVPSSIAQRYGKELLESIGTGKKNVDKLPARPKIQRRPKPDVKFDQRLARLKNLRNKSATEHDLPPGVLCPNGALQAVAWAAPKNKSELGEVEELRVWQRKAIGESKILDAVNKN